MNEVVSKDVDIVYGSRFIGGKHQNTSFIWHILGNGFLTKLSNLFSGYKLTDMMTCYKLVPTSIIQSISLVENRFGFEPEITMKLAKFKKLKIRRRQGYNYQTFKRCKLFKFWGPSNLDALGGHRRS